VTTAVDVNLEPLPGYRLIERLGAGGYGEVWRAEAPGGLTKAIKFVFGKHDEKRASHELRALERVRSVRHPFLLSLERIEVVGGRLLVVTELADGSIKDRFELCRGQGLPGIPRDELVGYLRDAADALDFVGQAHALQHLDIKPENLLVLAGHVKVADFGLVKDVRQSQASLVGGMTPRYAAPEVFRGIPSSHSDQYSLGILYQEMLRGRCRSPGATRPS
jgi:serine/threonine protein kinase